MDDIWIISWLNHTACDANPIWKSPNDARAWWGQQKELGREAAGLSGTISMPT